MVLIRRSVVCCILVFILVEFARGTESIGVWNTLTDKQLGVDNFASYYTWRGPERLQDLDNTTALIDSFTSKSPCRALTMHDNCFSHNPNRATGLLHRFFKSDTPSKSETPQQALLGLQNKLLIFAGDRTMASVFASLVCHFSQFSLATYNLEWVYDGDKHLRDKEGQDKCPGDPSCLLAGGETYFAAVNATFRYIQVNTYNGKGREAFQNFIHNETQSSVVVVNFGARYTDDDVFGDDLLAFRRDGVKVSKRLEASGAALQWFWLESAPRHYVNFAEANRSAALDASHTAKSHFNLLCGPIQDKVMYHKLDWRNRLVETLVPDFQRSARLIPIAEALYDQWDAHVDTGDSFRAEAHMDCTHYCVGSGVFRFIIDQVITSLHTCLSGNCMDKNFFDKSDSPVAKSASKVIVKRERVVTASTVGAACAGPGGKVVVSGQRLPVGHRGQQPMRGQQQRKRDPNCV